MRAARESGPHGAGAGDRNPGARRERGLAPLSASSTRSRGRWSALAVESASGCASAYSSPCSQPPCSRPPRPPYAGAPLRLEREAFQRAVLGLPARSAGRIVLLPGDYSRPLVVGPRSDSQLDIVGTAGRARPVASDRSARRPSPCAGSSCGRWAATPASWPKRSRQIVFRGDTFTAKRTEFKVGLRLELLARRAGPEQHVLALRRSHAEVVDVPAAALGGAPEGRARTGSTTAAGATSSAAVRGRTS